MRFGALIIFMVAIGILITCQFSFHRHLRLGLGTTPDDNTEIKQHIAHLKKIDPTDFFQPKTGDDLDFAPLTGPANSDGQFTITTREIKFMDDMSALVAYGPKALPFLLAALDDETPTKLILTHDHSDLGGMFFSDEEGASNNAREGQAIYAFPMRSRREQSIREDYPVTVGDVCFTIIGQIVARPYMAIQYQTTAITIINSPVHNHQLSGEVRLLWTSTNAAQTLLTSLLYDFSTNRDSSSDSFAEMGLRIDLSSAAAMRLLYYFPDKSAQLIADRLARLDVGGCHGNVTNVINRENLNGVRTENFIKAVAWSPAPAVRHAILDVFYRTTDVSLLLAALPALDSSQTNLIQTRLANFIDRAPADGQGPYGNDYHLLVALGNTLGETAKPIFVHYLEDGSLQHRHSMAKVLQTTQRQWAVELLAPALTDKRECGEEYALIPGQNEPRRQIRICDEAAETISLSRPALKFKMAGEHSDLDRQILEILKKIR